MPTRTRTTWTDSHLDFTDDQSSPDDQCGLVTGDPSPSDTQKIYVTATHPADEPHVGDDQIGNDPPCASVVSEYAGLRCLAETFADVQDMRVKVGNRCGAFMRDREDLGPQDRELPQPLLAQARLSERVIRTELRREFRRVVPPVVQDWVNSIPGLGEHSVARLLGVIGHPRIAVPKRWIKTGRTVKTKGEEGLRPSSQRSRVLIAEQPRARTVSMLWSFCGVGDPARKRRKGMTQEEAFACGSPNARKVIYLIAEACMKANRGPYRDVYNGARLKYAERVHVTPCLRCGPGGRPAPVGSPWSRGHQHQAALRLVSKEILRDLWTIYSFADDHSAMIPTTPNSASPVVSALLSPRRDQSSSDTHCSAVAASTVSATEATTSHDPLAETHVLKGK